MLLKKLLPALCALALTLAPASAMAQNLGEDTISLNFGVANLPLDLFEYSEILDFIAGEFVPEGVTASANFVLDFSPVPGGLSRMAVTVTLPNLFEFSGRADFIITEELTPFMEMETYQQLDNVLISSFEFVYTDHRFIALTGALAQCEEQRSVEQLRQDAFDFLGAQGANSHPLWDEVVQMLQDQLEKPGKVMLSYSPVAAGSSPVRLFELLFVRHPENYSLSWEQGQTPLLEQIPPSLRWDEQTNTGPCPPDAQPETVERPSADGLSAPMQQEEPTPDGSDRKQTRNAY